MGLPQAGASVLIFDISGFNDGDFLDENYGDRVTTTTSGNFTYGSTGGFTPNVEVAYNGADDLSLWTTGYNELTNVAYFEPESGAGYSITFTADPGYFVSLLSFNLGNFGVSVTLPNLQVQNQLGDILFNQDDVVLNSSSGSSSFFDLGTSATGAELTLFIDTTGLGGNSDNVGIDNIVFSQVAVPEPSSVLLAILGMSACFLRRR